VDQHQTCRPSRTISALVGLAAAALALGVAEALAGLSRSWRSPLLDVGGRVIDAAPPWLKEFAIDTFGTNDKPALLIGIATFLAVYAAVVGVVALRHRFHVGAAGVALFGLVGIWAARSRRGDASWTVVLPSVGGALAGVAVLVLARRALARPAAPLAGGGDVDRIDAPPEPAARATAAAAGPGPAGRRAFLLRSGAFIGASFAAAGALGGVGRWLDRRFSASESRAAVTLPSPVGPLADLPASVQADALAGVTPFITPNDRFYRIDTALGAPQVTTEDYRLRITGMVDEEIELTYEDLLGLDMIERDITLTCVSNEIGGRLVGNARWLGTRLDALLARAGVQAGADQVVGRSVDGYECGFPVSVAMDGRDAIVAVAMNGEPLPIDHGFPARLIVPGLYGYVSATKWLTEIELTTFAELDHYWRRRGWAGEAPIKLMSRIDTPKGLARVAPGTVPVAGVAWAQHTGIAGVEVRVDDGDWQPAQLAAAPSADTWVQWMWPWEATSGRHSVTVRAIDADGAIQTAERAEPIPDGASGHHEIVVIVE
jgi:DMSO/TMAO reductase YedYZ molybdopterin-dependent catalytic subunit